MYYRYQDSPLGPILITGDGKRLHSLSLPRQRPTDWPRREWLSTASGFHQCVEQLEEYFAHARRSFSLDLAPNGTVFQQRVWQALLEIPYGETRSYRDIATAVGNPKAVRAVGGANRCNPIAIVIPCHRVIGSNGALTGYAGGLHYKTALLELERDQTHTC